MKRIFATIGSLLIVLGLKAQVPVKKETQKVPVHQTDKDKIVTSPTKSKAIPKVENKAYKVENKAMPKVENKAYKVENKAYKVENKALPKVENKAVPKVEHK